MTNESSIIAFYAALSKSIKLLGAPFILIFISKFLSSEEMGFYFTFFSLISIQQLAELGLGQTLKQFISHAYKHENQHWNYDSKLEIKGYLTFALKWFTFVAFFVVFVVGPFGYFYYSDYNGDIEWAAPWLLLIVVVSITTYMLPILITIESVQRQISIYKAQAVSSFSNVFFICLLLYFDFGLYSIPVSLFFSNLLIFIFIYIDIKEIYFELLEVTSVKNTIEVFKELWPLFSKVAIVWGIGVLFWNGFNLVSFKIFTPEIAGKVIFTISLARAGYGIAESVFLSQITIISNKIANKKFDQAKFIFSRYSRVSAFFLLLGYIVFYIVWKSYPDFFLFDKIAMSHYVFSSFIFFFLLLILTMNNNYVRCFKLEPFLYVSLFHGLLTPVVFYVTNSYGFKMYLYPCCIILIFSIFFSSKISKKIQSSI